MLYRACRIEISYDPPFLSSDTPKKLIRQHLRRLHGQNVFLVVPHFP